MPFKPGQTGNAGGRPKKEGLSAETKASLRQAWIEVVNKKPYLVREAIERGLSGQRAINFLELGGKLMKEIGSQDEGKQQVVIMLNSSLDSSRLRAGMQTVKMIEVTPPQTELSPVEAELLELTGDIGGS